jgi:acyl-coenzyme A synthetase/AMP-(fatty) acid ligase
VVSWIEQHARRIPDHVARVDELPRNATGKVLEGPLRESARALGGSRP